MSANPERRFGPFTLLQQLGRGAAGRVFLARASASKDLPEIVVLKILHEKLLESPNAVRRFQHEAMIAVSLSAKEVVRVLDVGTVDGIPYFAMDYCPGWTLARVIEVTIQAGRTFDFGLVVAWMCDALRGLEALQAALHPETREPLRVVHRDIAPKNLLLGEDLTLRVIDLGLGSSSAQDWATRQGVLLGTPGYLSPEQAARGRTDARSDLYAIGAVAFELLTLNRYIPHGSLLEVLERTQSPGARLEALEGSPIRDAIGKAVAVSPDDRFESAEQFRLAIECFASHERLPSSLPDSLFEERELVRTQINGWAAVSESTLENDIEARTQVFAHRGGPFRRVESTMAVPSQSTFASLTGPGYPTLPTPAPTPGTASAITAPPTPIHPIALLTSTMSAPRSLPFDRAVPRKAPNSLVAVVALSAGIGLGYGLGRLDPPESPAAARPPPVAPSVELQPRVGVVEAAKSVPIAATSPPRDPATKSEERVALRKTHPVGQESKARAPASSAEPSKPAPSAAAVAAEFKSISELGRTLLRQKPERAQEIGDILTRAALLRQDRDVEAALADLSALSEKLRAIR
ncbi:MAG: serine/threonine protein kinase [Deltaproteobacteria bacterium]|nr:serine/threonine protein kinase [Deltaproteobacteria bacterium]